MAFWWNKNLNLKDQVGLIHWFPYGLIQFALKPCITCDYNSHVPGFAVNGLEKKEKKLEHKREEEEEIKKKEMTVTRNTPRVGFVKRRRKMN